MRRNLQRFFVAFATLMICLSVNAKDKLEKTSVMTGELTSVEALKSADFFILQNADGNLLCIPDGWDMKVKDINTAIAGTSYRYKYVKETAGSLLQVLGKDLSPVSIGWLASTEPYGTTTFINRQPAGQNVVFGLGLANRFGQDGENLALWNISYTAGSGFAFNNVGVPSYLASANGAACPADAETYWKAYTGVESGWDQKILADAEAWATSNVKFGEELDAIGSTSTDDEKAAAINAAIDSYNKVEEILPKLEAMGTKGAEVATAYGKSEYASYAEFYAAYQEAVKTQTAAGSDMTDAIVNPSFETGDLTGWTSTNGGAIAANMNFGSLIAGQKFVERWTAAPGKLSDGTLLQTIEGMPNGKYKLTANMQNLEQGNNSANGTGFFLVLNDAQTDCAAAGLVEVEGEVTDGTITLGVKLEGCTGNWMCVDNFELTLVEPEKADPFIEIEQSQSPDCGDGAGRATVEKGEGYTQYTSGENVSVIIKILDVDVKDCDYITMKFAEPTPAGIKASFAPKSSTANFDLPEGITEYTIKLDDANCDVNDNVLSQITLLTLWNSGKVVKIEGIYKHIAQAEEPEPEPEPEGPAQAEIADGDYIIVPASIENKYLGGANAWGTQASLVDHGQIFTLTKLENGKYNIDSHTYNNASNHFLGANGFIDSGAAEITICKMGEGTVSMSANEGKYFAPGEGTTVTAESEKEFAWIIAPVADLVAKMQEAAPVDATFLIKAANFSRNNYNKNFEGVWSAKSYEDETADAANSNLSGGNNLNNCAESWRSNNGFNIYQTIEVPNGVYTLNAQAAMNNYDSLTEGLPVVYANDVTSTFNDMTEGENSMSMMSASFTDGKYAIEPITVTVTDGKLTVGVKSPLTSIWAVWDNFELTYLGEPVEVETDLTKEMFFAWTAADGTAEQSGETTYPDYNIGTSTGMVYGYSTVNYLSFADLSEYEKMVITATEGTPRALFNRTVNEGPVGVELPRDAADYWTTVDNGDGSTTYTIDIAKIVAKDGFAHLHAIKGANWANTTVTSIKLIKKELPSKAKPAATLSDITLTLPEGADFEEDGDLKVVLDYKAALENCNGLLISGNAYYTVKDAEGQVVKTSSVDFDTDATTRNVFISGLKYNKDYVVTIDKMEVINTDLTTFESTALTTVEENLPSLSIKLVKPMATISGIELAQIPADQTLSASDKDFTVVFNYAIATEGCEGGIPAGCVEYTVKDANGNTVLDSSTDLDIDKTTRNIYLKGLNFDETYTMTVYKVSVNFLDITTFDTSIIEEVTEGLPTVTFTVAPPVKISNEAIAIQNVDLDANTAEASYSFKAAINAEYPDATAKVAYDIIDENGDVVANGTADVDLNTVPAIIKLENIPANGKFIVKINNIDIYQNANATDPIYNISSSAVGFCGIYQGYIASTGMLLTNGVSKSLEQNETVAVSAGEITFSRVMIPVVNISTGNFTVPVTTETNAEGQTIYKAQEVDVELHDVYISGGQDDPVPFKAWLVGIESTDGPILFLHLQSNLQDLFIAFNSRLQDAKWMMNSIAPEEVNAGGAKIINFLEATSINSVATDAKADGKYFENGKVVIKNNDKKYNVNGAIIK